MLRVPIDSQLLPHTGCDDFPTENPFQSSLEGWGDAYVTKLASTGNTLSFSTYLGGSSGDYGKGIAVDSSGNAYVTGTTTSKDFPQKPDYYFPTHLSTFITKFADTSSITNKAMPMIPLLLLGD